MKHFAIAIVAIVALFAAVGCGDDDNGGSTSGSVTVNVDGKAPNYNGFFTAYFPSKLTVHPGDTVQFKLTDTGEPHTVTLGTLTDIGLAAAAKVKDPNAPVPELDKLPTLLPQGPGDAVQSAANACFMDSGTPGDAACPKRQQPDFNGTQSFYNSGWLGADAPFNLKLAADIKPGTYSYFCLLHRQGMQGSITVVAKSTPAQNASAVKKAGDDEFKKISTDLQPAADQLHKLTADKAQAGNLIEAVQNAGISEFGPKEISIKTGGSVTWLVLGPHTISFNAPEDAKGARVKAPDGSFHINEKAFAPVGGPGQPAPPPNAPPPSAGPPIFVDGGSWDGAGVRSSGIFVSFPPGPLFGYKLSFTKAGTYTYKCLIHDKMEGTIKVSN